MCFEMLHFLKQSKQLLVTIILRIDVFACSLILLKKDLLGHYVSRYNPFNCAAK